MFTKNALSPDQSFSLKKTEDRWGRVIQSLICILLAIFPWMLLPDWPKPLEYSREVLLFSVTGILLIVWLFRSMKRKEFEWRRTKLGWLFLLWTIVLVGLFFIFPGGRRLAWNGYPGSLTGGLSEYLAFLGFYFLSIQVFSAQDWEKSFKIFLKSLLLSIIFFVILTIYFGSNSILTLNFAKTPTLIVATAGSLALAFWWSLKNSEELQKSKIFFLTLIFFFISSLLDFYLAWLMTACAILVILIFDFIIRAEKYHQRKEEVELGFQKEKGWLLNLIFGGEAKYLFLVLLFSLSQVLSPVLMGQQKLILFPFANFLRQYPLLGQRVVFYLVLNLIVFCFGLYYFWRAKKTRPETVIVLSGLVAISVGHLFYYSESVIFYFMNWLLIVMAGLTFLRSAPEKDFLYFFKPRSKGEGILFAKILILSALIVWLIVEKFY